MMVSKSRKVWAPRLANRPSRKRPPLWQGTMMLTRGAVTGRLISLVNDPSGSADQRNSHTIAARVTSRPRKREFGSRAGTALNYRRAFGQKWRYYLGGDFRGVRS